MAKRLHRATEEKSMIGGVCAGIAEYFEIDPTLVRLAFLFIVLARGAGVLAYIIAWVVIPQKSARIEEKGDTSDYDFKNKDETDNNDSNQNEKDEKKTKKDSSEKRKSSENKKFLGVILIAIGGIFLVDIWIPHFYWGKIWPILIIGLGLGILIKDQ